LRNIVLRFGVDMNLIDKICELSGKDLSGLAEAVGVLRPRVVKWWSSGRGVPPAYMQTVQEMCCGRITIAEMMEYRTRRPKIMTPELLAYFGGRKKAEHALGVSFGVSRWWDYCGRVPIDIARRIEAMTDGTYTVADLRPNGQRKTRSDAGRPRS
jgi:DNA-binding transcriptional regulator YdaS (Cro superfamily)